MTPPTDYAPTGSFESATVTAVAADADRVVLGTEAGEIAVVSSDGRTTTEFDDPVADLAVGNRIYALAGDTVAALSGAGTRVWSVELPSAETLAALPGADVLGVVTDDDAFLGFDGETGSQRFDASDPHADVTDDPGFFATDGAFVFVAWSFLAVRNPDGSERFDRNLDGAIESAGIVGETIVVSLKDERVVGIDAETGDRQWERELTVTDLPERGDDALLFTADGELVSLAPDGTYGPVTDLPSGDVYPTSDGSLFCVVADGTVSVYRSIGDPSEALAVEIDDAELVPGAADELDFTVRNDGDDPVSAALEIDGEGVVFAGGDRSIDLPPGESADLSVSVGTVTADQTATVAVGIRDSTLASASLPVASSASPTDALDVTAELDAVADGTATLAVTVRNDGETPLDGVSVSPGDARFERLRSGESATATVETEFDPGRTVPLTVRTERGETGTDVSLPDRAADLAIEATDRSFVDVRVENATDAELADDLAVEGDRVGGRVERRVELPGGGALVLALRPETAPGEVRVDASLDGLGARESATFDAGEFEVPAHERPSEPVARSATSEDAQARTPTGGAPSNAATDAERRTPDPTGAVLSADRTVESTDPARTQGVRERLTIENEGDETAEDVRASFPSETAAVGALAPGERATLVRRHAFAETGPVELPSGTVTAENASDARIDGRSLAVGPAEFAVEVGFDADDGGRRLAVTLTNRRDVGCDVTRIGVKGFGVWDTDLRVPPGETVEWTRPVESGGLSGTAVETAVEYAYDDRDPERWGTMGYVPDADADDPEGIDALAASVGEETRVSGGYGSVVLVVENASGSPVSDVSVEATGEAVSDLMYAGSESVERLDADEAFTHFVDVEAEGPDVSVAVALATDDDETELTLRGPAPADEDGWSESTLDEWRVERADGDGTDDSRPTHVASSFAVQ
ncbi:outer membrane protein assembly factor BamB family protein [Halorussus amylolyticus]|uniref:outer membrane protein assembly factor BamB family protein n=1 Tax=Halorussus amylolyticus TaxID=1126242 RepID=UPI00104ACE6D|nr:PQQ-binding-like beta-propeller repeat protein [Halorussus amylolyticus]